MRDHLPVPSYAWFSDWVDQHLGLTVTVAPGSDPADVLAAFGPREFDRGRCTLDEADDLDQFGIPVVRVGVAGQRAYAVEHFTTRGTDLVEPLSARGGVAVGVTFTQTIDGLMVARDGVLATGFDLLMPSNRYGSDQHAFDRELREAGLLADDGPARRGERVARFLELTTGVVLTPELIEGSLPCATLP